MVDVRGDVLRPPHGTTPEGITARKQYCILVLWSISIIINFVAKADRPVIDKILVFQGIYQ